MTIVPVVRFGGTRHNTQTLIGRCKELCRVSPLLVTRRVAVTPRPSPRGTFLFVRVSVSVGVPFRVLSLTRRRWVPSSTLQTDS